MRSVDPDAGWLRDRPCRNDVRCRRRVAEVDLPVIDTGDERAYHFIPTAAWGDGEGHPNASAPPTYRASIHSFLHAYLLSPRCVLCNASRLLSQSVCCVSPLCIEAWLSHGACVA